MSVFQRRMFSLAITRWQHSNRQHNGSEYSVSWSTAIIHPQGHHQSEN